jgi:hypothetical protein
MSNLGGSDYYLKRQEKYWRRLGRLHTSADGILPLHLDTGAVAQVGPESYREFHIVLSELPYIGGDGNMLTSTLVSSAAALGYIRVLERYGLPVETIGEILNAIYADVFTSLPGIVKWWLRRSEFSASHQSKLRAYAEESQRREYPGDWVMVYVEGDGERYDYGCDYTECAVLKFFRHMGADRYMPWVCVMDFTMSRALRTGLSRTKTLYYGGDCCNFRYKKNVLGQSSLPIEELPEYRNRSV